MSNNPYQKWGRDFADKLLRHIGTAITIWLGTTIKYQEVNLVDLCWFIIWGAILPTLAEFFKQGLPPDTFETTTTVSVKETVSTAPVVSQPEPPKP